MEDQGSAVSNVLRSKLRAGMISRREFIAAAAMLGVGTALSACAPDGTAAPAESEALAPRHGGKLVYGIDNQLQPFHYRTAWVAEAQWDIYERLLDRDPQGKLVPYLAESFKVSDDGLAVTFTLKP
ncbi:MAG TPA: twin-arginine translocation signal domain-containing protein, partial [Gemmatimonadales bacterium]|nr:twin-arginine translocation signal domain-containing protein [Gemmatimonadales bacterium]